MNGEALTRERGLIFRITHIRNAPWILDNGLHCRSSNARDVNFVDIGSRELIGKRQLRNVGHGPGGTLSDYVPFYFTPWSPMLLNIKTGFNGITQRPMAEIAILASSIPRLDQLRLRYLISDRHAYSPYAEFATDAQGLGKLDWARLRARDFKRDPEHPEHFDRYQAEALVHRHVPCAALLGIACYDEPGRNSLESELKRRAMNIKLVADKSMFC